MNRRLFLKLLVLLPFLDRLKIPEAVEITEECTFCYGRDEKDVPVCNEMYMWGDDGEVWYTNGSGATWTALSEPARIEENGAWIPGLGFVRAWNEAVIYEITSP